MAIKYRQELGRPLTYAEGDENFRTLEDSIEKTLAEYPTLTAAMADDIPDGVVFIVNDGDDAGYWRRDSSDTKGAVFLRDIVTRDDINSIQSEVDVLGVATARYAFDTLQEAQDKWASFSQEEKDALDGREFTIATGTDAGVNKWDSTETGGTKYVRPINLPPTGLVEEGNTEAVSGGEVFKNLIPTIKSRNIAKKSLLEWGVYRPTGVVSSASTHTYIRIEIPGIVEGKWYGASGGGGGNLHSSWARLVWFDSSNSVVGYLPNTSNFPIKEQAPEGAVKLGITVAYDSSVFSSLTDNVYANSLMVVELVDENEQIPNYTPPDLKQISIDTVYGLGEVLESIGSDDECFFEFNPTGFLGRGMFMVYIKREGAGNIYTGYKIGHRYDMSDLVYVDYYEIIEAFDYLYNGNTMTPTGRKTLFGGENEFTMKVEGKLDHTGGAHGDEIQSDFEFKPNGVKINDLSNAIPLTKCDFFEYSVKSTLHETVNNDAPTTPIEGHPVVANHVKNTFFGNRSLIVNNLIEVEQEFIPERIYTGLFCISNDQVSVGRNEWYNEATFVGDNAQKLNFSTRGYRDFYGHNHSHSASATSEMINNNELDKVASMFVTDRADGPKYYRYIKPPVALVGDIWHFRSEFKPVTLKTD